MDGHSSKIRAITAGIGPRLLPAGLLFLCTLTLGALLLVLALLQFAAPGSFWASEWGIGLAVVLFGLLMSFSLLPALLTWFSRGRLWLDSNSLRWQIGKEHGEIRWDRPFRRRRWRAEMVTYTSDENGTYTMTFPVIVYEIAQGDACLTLYRSASLKEVEGLPTGELRGVMLFQRARRITDALDKM